MNKQVKMVKDKQVTRYTCEKVIKLTGNRKTGKYVRGVHIWRMAYGVLTKSVALILTVTNLTN